MSWAKRLTNMFLGGVSSPSSRGRVAKAPRSRRVAMEPLEDRRLLSVGAEPVSFATRELGLPGDTDSILAADMDGDGDVDIVSYSGAILTWHENDGTEKFTPHSIEEFDLSISAISAVDFNGDAHADILVRLPGEVTWLENDGSASFTAHQILVLHDTGWTPIAIPTDVNEDGHIDIVSANLQDNLLAWHENDGNGNFSAHSSGYLKDDLKRVLAVADFTGDGRMDVLAAAEIYTRDLYAITYEIDGVFPFDDWRSFPYPERIQHVRVADFNADERPDIVVVPDLNDNYLLYEPSSSMGDFQKREVTSTGTFVGWTNDMVVTDLNGDGCQDLVAASAKDVPIGPDSYDFVHHLAWYENDGSGRFTVQVIDDERYISDIVATDIDQDGDVDLLVKDDTFIWYENLTVAAERFDFGDLPDNYGTTLAVDGARHEAVGPTLGATRDTEADGLPTVGADGDDANGSADEDGVTFGEIRVGQLDAQVTVNVQNAPGGAKLDAWIDFNGDGAFDGAGEQIADVMHLSDGDNTLKFGLPSTIVAGRTYARFRLSTDGYLSPTGNASDGEVEDYETVIRSSGSGDFVQRSPLAIQGGGGAIHSADVDGDGDMDVLSASTSDRIDWYENSGNGSFTVHNVSRSAAYAKSVFAADMDGDGDTDVLSASYSDDKIAWYENDGKENFTAHVVTTSATRAWSVFAADFDGDGNMDILSGSARGLDWYHNNGSEDFATHSISTIGGYPSVFATDVDGDGDIDALSASSDTVAWHENDGVGGFTTHTITNSLDNAISVFAADMDGDGDMDILSASWDDDKIAWYENDGEENFATQTISTSAESATSVFAADMDSDGDMDVVSADFQGFSWYENDGNESFTIRENDGQRQVKSVFATDVDGDGDVDVLASSWDDLKIAWHENDGSEHFTAHAVAGTAVNARSVFAADMDGDGDTDVLSGSWEDYKIAWNENDGDEYFASHTITRSAGRILSVYAADVDGDGDLDVVSGSLTSLAWCENDGSQEFTVHEISTSYEVANSVYASDVDGDGDMDVLSASSADDKIAWYENDGEENFTAHAITTSAYGALSVFAVDVDGDGDMDVLSASREDDKIAWYENDGEENFVSHRITASADEAWDVFPADMDGDGDLDVLSASYADHKIAWYENDGHESFTAHTITISAAGARSVFARDVDGDGDMDVLSASSEDHKIAWYENDGEENFTSRTITTSANQAMDVFAADVDVDGDLDVLSANFTDDTVVWYEQLGTPLGEVDFEDLPSLDLTDTEHFYPFTTARAGHLTTDATFDPAAGTVTLRLLDNQGQLIEEVTGTDGYLRIDHFAPTAGAAYELQVSGTNTNVDLRICNLVSQTGDTVDVFDTDGDDTYLFDATTPFNITVKGVEYHFDDATSFTFNSTAGQDTIEMVDSAGDDTLTASPTQMTLAGTLPDDQAFSATVNNFHSAHGYAKNGGTDAAQFVGSEGKDRVKVYPELVKLMGPNYYQRAKFFESVSVDTLGGTDWAVMVGSDEPDVVWAKENELRVDYDANLETGEKPRFADLDVDVAVVGTEYIVARARTANDWLELHDSALNDVLIAKPNKVELMNGPRDGVERGEAYRITARGFRNVSAIADQGGDSDVAKLYDSGEDGVDTWAAGYMDGQTWSTMSSPTRLLYEVLAFEQVGGYGFNAGLGENHGTNRKEHADDVDFVFQYGYWEADAEPYNPRNPRRR